MSKIVHESGVITYKEWATGRTWSEPPPNNSTSKDMFPNLQLDGKPIPDFSHLTSLPIAPISHPYLVAKKITPLTARIESNYLVILFENHLGKITGGQKIYPDGNKINLTGSIKKGTFHIIPASTEHETTYIVEGFATGASVHEATGSKVVITFGVGNFLDVLKYLNDNKIIIAADHDDAGISAAKATGYPYTYPPKNGMDWNDYAQTHNDVTEQIQKNIIKADNVLELSFDKKDSADELNFLFLGEDNEKFYFFHKEKKHTYELSADNITLGKLIYLGSLQYWDENHFGNNKKMICDIREATNFLVRGSFAAGKYIPNKVRGTGVWRDGESIIVNSLSNIWKDGDLVDFGQHEKYIYVSENSNFLNITNPASKEESLKLFELIGRLSWKNPVSADFLFGWLALAPMAGALAWRPHIWITGGRGSGKSEVKREIVLPMLNIDLDGSDNLGSSEAGIRQSRQISAAPLVYDEAEVTDQKTKLLLDSLIRTICLASDSSNSKVTKGSAKGESTSFKVNFSACLFSVGINSLEHPQYRSRFSILELVEAKDNGYSGVGGTQDQLRNLIRDGYCDRFFSKSLERLGVFHENFNIFYKILKDRFSARFAQQVGTLLAASYTMQFLPDKNIDAVEKFISQKDLYEENMDNSSKNEQDCLHYLFSKKIIEAGQSYTIGELAEDVQDISSEFSVREKKESLLVRHGIKYLKTENVLAISNTNAELKNIFRNTAWESGWSRTLGRLPFVFKKSFQVKMNGQNQRCTCIDLDKLNEFLLNNGETNEKNNE